MATTVLRWLTGIFVLCPSAFVQGQTVQHEPVESAIVSSRAVPEGLLRGIVVDSRTGSPLRGAHVNAWGNGTTADSLGLFSFSVPAEAPSLVAEFINYFRVELPIPRDEAGGWIARIALQPGNWHQPCEYLGEFGVTAEIRDALTGRPPESGVTLSIEQDTVRVSVAGVAAPEDDWLYLDATIGGMSMGPRRVSDSPIIVEVQADGYADWRRDSVVIERDRCGHGLVGFRVFLLPTVPSSTAVPR